MRPLTVVPALLLLAACPGGRPASAPAPEPGRYEYTGRYLPPGAAQPHLFRGVLVVTSVTRERIDGRWEVPGFDPDVQLGAWTNGAYDIGANVSHEGLVGAFDHRIVPGRDGAWTCTAVFVGRMGGGGAPVSNPATCTLARAGG
jgi:hypothetical protein